MYINITKVLLFPSTTQHDRSRQVCHNAQYLVSFENVVMFVYKYRTLRPRARRKQTSIRNCLFSFIFFCYQKRLRNGKSNYGYCYTDCYVLEIRRWRNNTRDLFVCRWTAPRPQNISLLLNEEKTQPPMSCLSCSHCYRTTVLPINCCVVYWTLSTNQIIQQNLFHSVY